MSVSAMWMRNNMLSYDQHGRQFTEAEMKVQRSLQTLSIPEWYLNKRSSPPKILTNTPIDCRPPTWKYPDWKRISVTNLSALTISDTPSHKSEEKPGPNNPSTGTYKVQRYQKSPSTTTEKMDTTIPHITPRRDISKTFPKMSPSRKLNNINIVLNRKPSPLELPRQDDNPIPDASNYGTYVLTKRAKSAKKTNNDLPKSAEDSKITPEKTSSPNRREGKREQPEDNLPEPIYAQITPQKTRRALKTSSPKKRATEREEQPEDNIQSPEPIYAQITPKTKSKFKVRAASTPKFSPGSLLSSTIVEESPKGRRQPSENILRKLSIFEDSWKDRSMRDDSEKASRSMENRTSTLKSECDGPLSVSYEETPKRSQRLRNLLDKNIRSIDPILFEPVDSLNSSTSVREIVKKVESVCIDERTPVKRSHLEWKKSMVPAVSTDMEESPKSPVRQEKDAKSPCARPHNSRRMSMVPENWRSIEEALKAPVQLRKDKEMEKKNVETPSSRISKPRRMSMVPEDWRSIEEALKAPVQLRKDKEMEKKNVESPNIRISKSRRMSMVPEDWRSIEEAIKAPVQLRKDKEMEKKKESPSSRISKSRRLSIIPEELKELREASRILAQRRKEMERSFSNADSPATKFFNSRRTSLESCEIKNIGESSKRKDTDQGPDQANSPSTRFLTSRRKSMELENLVRSKQPSKGKSVVREIITAMTARAIKQAQLRKQENVPGAQQNFVKTVVDALEKGNSSLLDDTIQESFASTIRNVDDLGSASESDAKSSSTPVYSNDTESSDSDGRSPILVESDDSRKILDFDISLDASKASQQKHRQEDDSVYWIPVARCKLPRTSSLLSMMSRLSTNGDSSPCVSPIKSDSENENAQIPWGATFKKNPALSKNLFRIDETIVIDSGYSDRSDKSPAGCTTTDSNLSEDTQNESSPAVSSKNKITRASRRKCGTGTTFRVSKF